MKSFSIGLIGLCAAWSLDVSAVPLFRCDTGNHVIQARGEARPSREVRPPEVGAIDSTTLPVRLHYQQGVSDAYIQLVMGDIEQSWKKLFVDNPFRSPLPDGTSGGDSRFDFYIVTNMQTGVGGYTGFSGFADDSMNTAIGYIVLAHDIDSRLRRGAIAHELFHASQMAYDWWESISFMEASSVWASDFVFPDENMIWRYFTFFNLSPHQSLDFVSLMDPYQYGSGMWPMFLDERFGAGDGAMVRQIWERIATYAPTQKPAFFKAVNDVLQPLGSDLQRAFVEFGGWRAFVGTRNDGKHYHKAANWTGWSRTIEPTFEVTGTPGMMSITGHSDKAPNQYGQSFMSFRRPAGEKARYMVSLVFQPGARFVVQGFLRDKDGWRLVQTSRGDLQIDNDGTGTEFLVVVSNLADDSYQPNGTPWKGTAFDYRFDVSAAN